MLKEDDMILTVDVGNSSIGYAIFQNHQILFQDIISSRYDSELDAIIARLKEAIRMNNLDISRVKAGIMVSVVPSLTMIVQMAFKNVFKIKLVAFKNNFKVNVNLLIDDPKELGADLVADLVAMKRDYPMPAILVDLGTVNKTLFLDQEGNFIGCYFFPGMKSCVRSLGDEAALLPNLNRIEKPAVEFGKNTEDAILSGVFYGTLSSIEGIANHYDRMMGKKVTRVISGGFSKVIASTLTDFKFDLDIVMRGLYYLFLDNIEKFNLD